MSKYLKGKTKFEIIYTIGLWTLAIAIIALNVSLIFDNVLWGDEAFSANTIRDVDFGGILQRIYYLDNHPPLYYFLLKVFSLILGNQGWVYHLCSVVTFSVGIIFALTYLSKKLGMIPVTFYVLFTGLSAVCVEYNLEVRMYSLVFLMILICVSMGKNILDGSAKKSNWVLMVITGVLAAYTHYFGLVTSGIFIFYISLWYFLKNKGKTWLYGVISIFSYIILYTPWLFVFIKQALGVKSGWWMNQSERLSVIIRFMLGGKHMVVLLFTTLILLTAFLICVETKLIRVCKGTGRGEFLVRFSKPDLKNVSDELRTVFVCFITIITVLVFAYAIGAVTGQPILADRYSYPLIPLVLVIFMSEIKRVLDLTAEKEGRNKTIVTVLVLVWMGIVLIIGLFDFKYFRSVSKVQQVKTNEVLELLGDVDKKALLTSYNVSHLGWTVLEYYYPQNEVSQFKPEVYFNEGADFNEIWIFAKELLDETDTEYYAKLGFNIENFEDYWMGKYHCDIIHLYK